MSKNNPEENHENHEGSLEGTPDEDMEVEDLSSTEDEDRIFILDENGKSVEVEVEDDAADD